MAMTPTTALLNSCLDISAFESPKASPNDLCDNRREGEQDPFAYAFQKHTTGSTNNHLRNQNALFQLKGHCTTPPPITADSPATGFFDLASLKPADLSEGPSYLEHVLSTQCPDDIFSYAQRCHNRGRFSTGLVALDAQKEDMLQVLPAMGGYDDHFTPAPRLHDVGFPQAGNSKASSASDTVNAKKTRKRRKNWTDEEEAARHKAFLERNRKAAGKCRMKKKDKTQQMLADMDAARLRNAELKAEHMELMAEVAWLRELVQRSPEMTYEQMVALGIVIGEATHMIGNKDEDFAALEERTNPVEEAVGGQEKRSDAVDEMDHEMTMHLITEEKMYRDRIPSLVSTSSKDTLEESETRSRDDNHDQEQYLEQGQVKEGRVRKIDYVVEAMDEYCGIR